MSDNTSDKMRKSAYAERKGKERLAKPRIWPIGLVCNSRKLDNYINKKHANILQYEQVINKNLGKKQIRRSATYKKQLRDVLRCLTLNLYVTGKISNEHRLILPSGAKTYLTNFRLRSIGLQDYRYVRAALGFGGLDNNIKTKGYFQKEREVLGADGKVTKEKKKGEADSYLPRLQFINEIERIISLENIKQKPIKKQDLVILKKRKKKVEDGEVEAVVEEATEEKLDALCEAKKLSFRAQKEVKATRELLFKYNKLLAASKIEFKPTLAERIKIDNGLLPNILQVQTYQLYTSLDGTNTDFKYHGRFYGGFWIPLKGNLRKHITIDGKPLVELDFRTMHPLMLYIKHGVDFRNKEYAHKITEEYDLYGGFTFTGFKPDEKKHRNLAKKLLNAAINAKDFDAAIGSAMKDYNKDKKKEQPKYPPLMENFTQKRSLEAALNQVLKRHTPIAKSLNDDAGMRLMRYDSMIAEKVMQHFTDKGEIVLTVHDSFLVKEVLAKELKEVMFEALKEVASTHIREGYNIPYTRDDVIK
jgi:hypothetical protein